MSHDVNHKVKPILDRLCSATEKALRNIALFGLDFFGEGEPAAVRHRLLLAVSSVSATIAPIGHTVALVPAPLQPTFLPRWAGAKPL